LLKMRLYKALKISRVFKYKGIKYFAFVWVKNPPTNKFTVVCNKHPLSSGDIYDFSSLISVKPVIRENAKEVGSK